MNANEREIQVFFPLIHGQKSRLRDLPVRQLGQAIAARLHLNGDLAQRPTAEVEARRFVMHRAAHVFELAQRPPLELVQLLHKSILTSNCLKRVNTRMEHSPHGIIQKSMAGELLFPQHVHDYLLSNSLREPPILARLREQTAAHPRASMQISPEHGQFMALIIQLMGARRAIEVGVFTGYSALAVALAMPAGGKIVACDVSEEYTGVARAYWKEAGVDRMIDLRLNPALDTLRAMIAAGERGTYDFAFIDADKTNYEAYYECALQLIRPGGLIMLDNVLWSGRVADPDQNDADTQALRALNKKLHADARVLLSMLPLSDGVTLALKK